ncbi:hypothetical protein M434DRAFT_372931 [Hypoxylon sp. CO27-5]|nr:hypothetical protein M434DRAFT_372931 [Hypoxylon sp. CO27-5]
MPDNAYPDVYSPGYYSPRILSPRIPNEARHCQCDECEWARSYQQRMNLRSSSEPDLIKSSFVESPQRELPRMRNGQNNGARNTETKPRNRRREVDAHPLAVTTTPRPEMAYPEVYIYPSTSHHITFPVVDYSSRQRTEKHAPWPACYLAISPPCSKPADFEAALCPQGSKLIAVARLSKTKKTAYLSAFKDAEELRRESIQLEVWDEDAAKDAKNGLGGEAEAGSAKKKKGRNKD